MKFSELFFGKKTIYDNAQCNVCKTVKTFEIGTLDKQKCDTCRESFWVK